jgi:hypothetical protein
VASCSSDDNKTTTTTTTTTGGMPCVTFDYSKYTVGTTPRTLDNDVMPIFMNSCALSMACHLNGTHPPNLGGSMATPATVAAAIVDMASTEVPSWKYVAKGAPEMSYLMRKIEDAIPGCMLNCTPPAMFADACTGPVGRMPQNGPYLTDMEQGLIRDWIKQGAN